jgi:hypothetical protein
MKKLIREFLEDALALVGCGCILFGLSLWSTMLTWIVAGVMLIGIGVLVGKANL